MTSIEYHGSGIQHKYGWISPDGEFFGCEYTMHMLCADAIAKALYPREAKRIPNPEEILEDHGFVKITRPLVSNRHRVEIFPGTPSGGYGETITQKQADTIRALGYGEELEYIDPVII